MREVRNPAAGHLSTRSDRQPVATQWPVRNQRSVFSNQLQPVGGARGVATTPVSEVQIWMPQMTAGAWCARPAIRRQVMAPSRSAESMTVRVEGGAGIAAMPRSRRSRCCFCRCKQAPCRVEKQRRATGGAARGGYAGGVMEETLQRPDDPITFNLSVRVGSNRRHDLARQREESL